MVSLSTCFATLVLASGAPVLEARDGHGPIADQMLSLYLPEDVLDALYEYSPLNTLLSAIAKPSAQTSAPAFYNLLTDKNAHVDNVDANSQNSDPNAPTVRDFIRIAEVMESTSIWNVPAPPSGISAYNVPNSQVQLSAYDTGSGMNARVFKTDGKNKLIIAYSGWNPNNLPTDIGAFLSDEGSIAGKISEGQKNAAAFGRLVYQIAKNNGYSAEDIYITGHSLGACQAEYAAQQLGFGGIAFEGTGIPAGSNPGSNFISTVNYGDVWGSYASDVPNNPLEELGTPQNLNHYGKVVMAGEEQHAEEVKNWINTVFGNPVAKQVAVYKPLSFLLAFIWDQISQTTISIFGLNIPLTLPGGHASYHPINEHWISEHGYCQLTAGAWYNKLG